MSELNLFPLLWWGNLYFQSNSKPANCPHIRMGRAEGVPWAVSVILGGHPSFQGEVQRYILGSHQWNHWGRSWLVSKYIIIAISKSTLIISLWKWKLWAVWQVLWSVAPCYWQQHNYYYHCYYPTEIYLQTLNGKYFYLVSCQIPGVPPSVLVNNAYKHPLDISLLFCEHLRDIKWQEMTEPWGLNYDKIIIWVCYGTDSTIFFIFRISYLVKITSR